MPELFAAPCDDGDERSFDETSGHCYLRFNGNVTWPAALAACEAINAHLVVFESAAEEAFVTMISNNDDRWIGLTDSALENTFVWVTDEPMVYINWDDGEPNDGAGGEDCAIYAGDSDSWDDRECDQTHGYFCEREPQPAP